MLVLAPIRLRMPPKAHPAPVSPSVVDNAPSLRQAPLLRPAMDGGPVSEAVVQLGSWRSRAEAETGWTRALAKARGALDGLAHDIQAADLPGRGRYYRLRVQPGPDGARALCGKLRAHAMDCLILGN